MSMNRRTFLGTSTLGLAGFGLAGPAQAQPVPEADKPAQPGKTPNTKFAVNVEMWWRKLKPLQRVDEAAKLGFPAIEFWPYTRWPVDELAKKCEEKNIAVAQFGAAVGSLNNIANKDQFVDKVKKACEVAHKLKCNRMTVLSGNNVKGKTLKQMHDKVVESCQWAAPILEKEKVMFIIEPLNIRVDHRGHSLYSSDDAIAICKKVGSPMVKINWDMYHQQITEGDIIRRLKDGYSEVGYIQIADNPGRNEPGTGEINYSAVFKAIKKMGYDYYVGLECRPQKNELLAAQRIYQADAS